jgi:anti-sigma regulatory factor (Ser/Thr protein kinase)
MQLSLKTYYRMEFLPLVVSFVTETARCLGATPKEISELGMASDEAGMHIIERFPGDGLEEQFEVVCEVQEGALRVVFSNMGLPVNPEALPKFETAQPEETIDGLGLFLIEKLVDHFEFVNQGRSGWRTVMVKKLAHLKAPVSQANEEAENLATAREKLRIVQAGVEHVPGIVELAYRNYGYSYSKDLFYYTDQLRNALLGGKIESFIALNPDDRVVGQMAILHSPNSQEVAEVGAVMIQPEYRRSMGLLQLLKVVNQAARNHDHQLAVVEANLVTTHTLSQKVCGMFHFKPMALKLSVHGRAKFLALAEDADNQRESLLHAITAIRPVQPVRLFVPPRHMEITKKLFTDAGITLEFPEHPQGRAKPPAEPCQHQDNNAAPPEASPFYGICQ